MSFLILVNDQLSAVKLVGVDGQRARGTLVKRASVVKPLGVDVVARLSAHFARGVGWALILAVGEVVGRGVETVDDGLSFGLGGKCGGVDCVCHFDFGFASGSSLRQIKSNIRLQMRKRKV